MQRENQSLFRWKGTTGTEGAQIIENLESILQVNEIKPQKYTTEINI